MEMKQINYNKILQVMLEITFQNKEMMWGKKEKEARRKKNQEGKRARRKKTIAPFSLLYKNAEVKEGISLPDGNLSFQNHEQTKRGWGEYTRRQIGRVQGVEDLEGDSCQGGSEEASPQRWCRQAVWHS